MSDSNFYDVICEKECRNTHHKLVMNSLLHLTCTDAEKWRALFVRHFDLYLQGSKDPDTKFKDFRNHVLHVSDNFWGGPVKQAQKWYGSTVEHLRNENWKSAVYSAGVLSHYYMDPIMPLHTGQTEEEGVIHRACEWSVNKSFKKLIDRLEAGSGYPDVRLPSGNDWLKDSVHNGAILAHTHYQSYIDHYNIELGAKDPPAGLDDHLQEITSQLLGYASVGFAKILERAFEESSASPAQKSGSLLKSFYLVTAPVSWVSRLFTQRSGQKSVRRIAAEYDLNGKVIDSLPPDEKQMRALHATEILNISLVDLDRKKIGPIGSKSTNSIVEKPSRKAKKSDDKFRLEPTEPLENAPSIGPRTASRFGEINIHTVSDFLAADPVRSAKALNVNHIQEATIRDWQIEARLACQIPRIYGHDAQILAACGFESPNEIANSEPAMILSLVDEFAKTRESKFIIRNNKPPDLKEVTDWVAWSKQSRSIKVA